MKTSKEKASYCIGLETGKNIIQQFSDVDLKLLQEGFQDAISNTEPKLKIDEIRSILVALRNQIETQQREFIAKLAEDNKKKGEAFLIENKAKDGIVSLPSGLQYKVLTAGKGGDSPTLLDTVAIHYRGSFIDGKVFESSYERGEPATLPVNRSIPGWSEALQKMHIGDKWQLFIPSYLAYGEMGFGNDIAPNTTLVFEVELLGINNR